jgi:hypothetical protein
LAPVATATKEVQGPVGLVETCFSRAMPGLGALTVNESVAVFPVVVVPEIVAWTAPLVLG